MIDIDADEMSEREWFHRLADPRELDPPMMTFEREDQILEFIRILSWIARDKNMSSETFFDLLPKIVGNIALLRRLH